MPNKDKYELAYETKNNRHKCHDCGATEGEIHKYGCDMERCPFCGGQLISCMCDIDQVEGSLSTIDDEDIDEIIAHTKFARSTIEKIQKALDKINYEKWLTVLEAKGRIPYIVYPQMCARCGEPWPDFFSVPDEEWNHYIQPDKRRDILCRACYDKINAVIDSGALK